MATESNCSSVNLVDEFEIAFQNCFANLNTQENNSPSDSEEVKSGVEQSIQKFLDVAKQIEAFFLQKRLILSVMKPEQIVKEDVNEMGTEIARKDQLLQKHYLKLQHWQNMLRTLPGAQPPQQNSTQPTPQQNQQQTAPHSNQPVNQNVQQSPHSQTQHMGTHNMQGHGVSQNIGMQHPHHLSHQQVAGNQASIQFQQGPLAHLERTTSNIGLPDGSR